MPETASPPVDGRRARRQRGRLAVVDAMVDLVREGHRPPAVDAVAERAGVSVASIFRYFENLDDLQNQTSARFFERYAPLFEVPRIGVGPLESRIARYVESRVALYETIAPIARFARSRSLDQPHLAAELSQMRRRLVSQAAEHFASELSGRTRAAQHDLVGSIATLTSFESWDALRHELDGSPGSVRRAWTSGLRALCVRAR